MSLSWSLRPSGTFNFCAIATHENELFLVYTAQFALFFLINYLFGDFMSITVVSMSPLALHLLLVLCALSFIIVCLWICLLVCFLDYQCNLLCHVLFQSIVGHRCLVGNLTLTLNTRPLDHLISRMLSFISHCLQFVMFQLWIKRMVNGGEFSLLLCSVTLFSSLFSTSLLIFLSLSSILIPPLLF